MSTTVSDSGIEVNGIDSRAITPYKECGTIFAELFPYAIDMTNKCFSQIFIKEKQDIHCDLQLAKKDELANFNDLRYTIKSYNHILSVFLSTGVILELRTPEENAKIFYAQEYMNDCSKTLENYLLNNPHRIKKTPAGYYQGKIELEFYRLIQELYQLALNGHSECRWMLSFNTPLQIWFVAVIQQTYILCCNDLKISDRAYYETCANNIENINGLITQTTELSKEVIAFSLSEALQYTIAQLITKRAPRIGSTYTEYLKCIKQQARQVAKESQYRFI